MKVLFLEDDAIRIQTARREFVGHSLIVAQTSQEAIQFLNSESFDLASLDHDLGGTQMAESNEMSGYAVAQHLAAMPATTRPYVIVHSFNPVGAENMARCFETGSVLRALFGTAGYWALVRQVSEKMGKQDE